MLSRVVARRATAPSALSRLWPVAAPPLLAARARPLCDEAAADEARKAELLEFLRSASRPIMGQAKARQSAGQRPIDLTKQMKNLEDLSFHELLRIDGAELKKRGVPVQDRKRIRNFADKYVQGYRHDGRTSTHSW